MGLTGLLELTALAMSTLNLVMTLLNRRRTCQESDPLTPDVRVREAVNARPELQSRLGEIGITMFDAAPFITPSITFGALAYGRRPKDLVATTWILGLPARHRTCVRHSAAPAFSRPPEAIEPFALPSTVCKLSNTRRRIAWCQPPEKRSGPRRPGRSPRRSWPCSS